MEQHDAAGKLLLEMLENEIITDEQQEAVYTYLMLAFGVGFDRGRIIRAQEHPVIQKSIDGNPIKIYPSIKVAARKMGCSKENIMGVLKKRQKTAAGFKWEYVNPDHLKPPPENTIKSFFASKKPKK